MNILISFDLNSKTSKQIESLDEEDYPYVNNFICVTFY